MVDPSWGGGGSVSSWFKFEPAIPANLFLPSSPQLLITGNLKETASVGGEISNSGSSVG